MSAGEETRKSVNRGRNATERETGSVIKRGTKRGTRTGTERSTDVEVVLHMTENDVCTIVLVCVCLSLSVSV